MQDLPDRELPTADVGRFIMRSLKSLDKVAYVRFASVYLEFEDVSEFMAELKTLFARARPPQSKRRKKIKPGPI